tara:strand:+ start:90 stop:356 length:267 start_codon:yes stop_codon:yes gene_type:complete
MVKQKMFKAKNGVGVEVAPSSRSGCRICEKQIFKGRPRIYTARAGAFDGYLYYHPSCWQEEDERIWEYLHDKWEDPDEIESQEADYER